MCSECIAERLNDLAFQHPAYSSRTELSVEASIDNGLNGVFINGNKHSTALDAVTGKHLFELNLDDLFDIFGIECAKGNHLIDAIEKLGSEETLCRLGEHLRLARWGNIKADPSGLLASTEIAGHDNDRRSEICDTPSSVR